MNTKSRANPTFKKFQKQVKDFALEKPWYFAGIVVFGIIVFFRLLSSLEILPEKQEPKEVTKGMVIEKGDSLMWVGMELAPLSRSIRKEFNIQAKIKGMFVIDEGKQLAQKYGVKTGDVIVAIGRKPVATARAFVKVANSVQYTEGILLDINRDGKTLYIAIPFEYQYGPLLGPNKGSWQLGSPFSGKVFQYGPVFK
ncbi:MAG TPA: hypothetical protein DD723_01310 [Candidatus Omnitrophica bacterium]|nr:MAG: hypothetical protein A2Z81_02115 [Omnitrophica WOR_2 bacterium GWA2_45_18]OGX19940.1 MAG: hypothetical protein A2Y04_04160 [Omnitrophica WOR_2 bacterium GWC2_45_7]HBR14169.1 hypothetical protein [Candidatus Omnitrophota bacterium]